jgi:hypothetical protein
MLGKGRINLYLISEEEGKKRDLRDEVRNW